MYDILYMAGGVSDAPLTNPSTTPNNETGMAARNCGLFFFYPLFLFLSSHRIKSLK